MEMPPLTNPNTYVVASPIWQATMWAICVTVFGAFLIYCFNDAIDPQRNNWILICFVGLNSAYCFYKAFFCEHFWWVTFNFERGTIDVGYKRLLRAPFNSTYSGADVSGIEWEASEIRLFIPGGRHLELPVSANINSANLGAENFALAVASALDVPFAKVTYKVTGDGG